MHNNQVVEAGRGATYCKACHSSGEGGWVRRGRAAPARALRGRQGQWRGRVGPTRCGDGNDSGKGGATGTLIEGGLQDDTGRTSS
jgi:hypothetical protein